MKKCPHTLAERTAVLDKDCPLCMELELAEARRVLTMVWESISSTVDENGLCLAWFDQGEVEQVEKAKEGDDDGA